MSNGLVTIHPDVLAMVSGGGKREDEKNRVGGQKGANWGRGANPLDKTHLASMKGYKTDRTKAFWTYDMRYGRGSFA
jgi:hypothetical protein